MSTSSLQPLSSIFGYSLNFYCANLKSTMPSALSQEAKTSITEAIKASSQAIQNACEVGSDERGTQLQLTGSWKSGNGTGADITASLQGEFSAAGTLQRKFLRDVELKIDMSGDTVTVTPVGTGPTREQWANQDEEDDDE